MDEHFIDGVGIVVGLVLLAIVEYTKIRVKRGPLGELFELYVHKYLLIGEFGILSLTVSLISSFSGREVITFGKYNIEIHHLLIGIAMILFALSGRILLQEVERAIRHRQKGEEILEHDKKPHRLT